MIRHPPRSPLFPYPPLSRSRAAPRPACSPCAQRAAPEPRRPRPPPAPRRPQARLRRGHARQVDRPPHPLWARSEEHTSELQSRLHLVCRLLLEKKKTTTRRYIMLGQSQIGFKTFKIHCNIYYTQSFYAEIGTAGVGM